MFNKKMEWKDMNGIQNVRRRIAMLQELLLCRIKNDLVKWFELMFSDSYYRNEVVRKNNFFKQKKRKKFTWFPPELLCTQKDEVVDGE